MSSEVVCCRVLAICLFFFLVDCIKCWVCRSDSDPKCADPFDNTTVPITDCKQELPLRHMPMVKPTMCRKIRQKGNYFIYNIAIFSAYYLNILFNNFINYLNYSMNKIEWHNVRN